MQNIRTSLSVFLAKYRPFEGFLIRLAFFAHLVMLGYSTNISLIAYPFFSLLLLGIFFEKHDRYELKSTKKEFESFLSYLKKTNEQKDFKENVIINAISNNNKDYLNKEFFVKANSKYSSLIDDKQFSAKLSITKTSRTLSFLTKIMPLTTAKSIAWIVFLLLFWKPISQAYTNLNSILSEQTFLLQVNFYIQTFALTLPFISLIGLKKVFGKNNIITRNFSSKKINNSALLRGLNNLLNISLIVGVFVLIFIAICLFQAFFEQTNYLFEQFKYNWEHSLFVNFSYNLYQYNHLVLVLMWIFTMGLDIVLLCAFLTILMLVIALGMYHPYLLLAVLLYFFLKSPTFNFYDWVKSLQNG